MDMKDIEVLIIGAGPIGLLLGNFLGQRGIKTLIIDKKEIYAAHSKAIGITPPSLEILGSLGLTSDFIKEGVKIQDVRVHGKGSFLGQVTFDHISSPFPFVLSIPQEKTEAVLLKNLKSFPSVRLMLNCELMEIQNSDNRVQAKALLRNNNKEEDLILSASYLCACDGFKSKVRELSSIVFKGRRYTDTFLMGDYRDRTAWGRQARLFFTSSGSVESFPLPGKKRRWVIQTPSYNKTPLPGYLESEVKKRSLFDLSVEDKISESPFKVYKYIMERFFKGRVLFLGDAAHTISPIGGQGMNTGFADAELAEAVLANLLQKGHDFEVLKIYEHCRKKAAETAAHQAWLSMRVGTVKTVPLSGLRNYFIKTLLKMGAGNWFSRLYAMLTIPFRNKEQVSQTFKLDFPPL